MKIHVASMFDTDRVVSGLTTYPPKQLLWGAVDGPLVSAFLFAILLFWYEKAKNHWSRYGVGYVATIALFGNIIGPLLLGDGHMIILGLIDLIN